MQINNKISLYFGIRNIKRDDIYSRLSVLLTNATKLTPKHKLERLMYVESGSKHIYMPVEMIINAEDGKVPLRIKKVLKKDAYDVVIQLRNELNAKHIVSQCKTLQRKIAQSNLRPLQPVEYVVSFYVDRIQNNKLFKGAMDSS